MPVGNYEELLPLSLKAMAGKKDPIWDGFQVMEFSDKTLVHAENIEWNDLEKFMRHPSLLELANDLTPIQDVVDNSLWKCPMPKEWHFCEGDMIVAQSITQGIVKGIQCMAIEMEIEGLGDYVEVSAGEYKGRTGYVQGTHNPVLMDILEGATSTGVGIPWLGLQVLVLPAIDHSKKCPLNLMAVTLHVNTGQANDHKGKIGTVLDVNIDQTLDSGLRVYVRLEQNYSSSHAFPEIWLDYNEVVEEMMGLPLCFYQPLRHDQEAFLPSLQYRRNVWDTTAPEPPDPSTIHWSRDPWLAQHQLWVNIPGKSQSQKVLLELSGTRCNMKIMFRTTLTEVLNLAGVTPLEPTVHDFHRWVIIKGPHVGQYVRGICYVQGTKPILWTVHEITLVQDKHDSLVGKAFNILSGDLYQVADTQHTLDINYQWAQSICEEPIKPKKQRKA
ncbi:hypothetical protein IW262DRAFT_1300340 [Armillaria fumosa]|nr:hypothetical protein IW262DRAFT_1300340 [Armillaria fumosa]